MKTNIIAVVSLLGLASANLSPGAQLFARDTGAECHAKDGQTCSTSGAFGCEDNGGHSLQCTSGMTWMNRWNCPDYDGHCDCATGKCAPNDPNNDKIPDEARSMPKGSGNPAPSDNSSPSPYNAVAGAPGNTAAAGPGGVVANAPGVTAGITNSPVPALPPTRRGEEDLPNVPMPIGRRGRRVGYFGP